MWVTRYARLARAFVIFPANFRVGLEGPSGDWRGCVDTFCQVKLRTPEAMTTAQEDYI